MSWPRGSNIRACADPVVVGEEIRRRSPWSRPSSSGPPPVTRRTGLPQVWPSMQEKRVDGHAPAYAASGSAQPRGAVQAHDASCPGQAFAFGQKRAGSLDGS